jgi:hypothetical protein
MKKKYIQMIIKIIPTYRGEAQGVKSRSTGVVEVV